MPALDQLCREGAVFERFFSTAPICMPARYTIITGQYPHTHGEQDNQGRWVPEESPIFMEHLSWAGLSVFPPNVFLRAGKRPEPPWGDYSVPNTFNGKSIVSSSGYWNDRRMSATSKIRIVPNLRAAKSIHRASFARGPDASREASCRICPLCPDNRRCWHPDRCGS